MLTNLFLFLVRSPFHIYWRWSYWGFGNGIPDTTRLRRLKKMKAPNGPKQIIMLQIANTLWRLDRVDEALSLYALAKQDEIEWGGRKLKPVSRYIQ